MSGGPKLRHGEGGILAFHCPGCGHAHTIRVGDVEAPGQWSFNGDEERPTFKPSVLLKNGHFADGFVKGSSCWCTYAEAHPNDPTPFKCTICHSFISDGRIRFLEDSTHALKGQTVNLPDWPSGRSFV